MTATQVAARLTWRGWLTAERLAALPGSRQGFTAGFPGGDPDDQFSVILRFAADADAADGTSVASLELLAPDQLPDVTAALVPGCRLTIYSGPRTVAECTILPGEAG